MINEEKSLESQIQMVHENIVKEGILVIFKKMPYKKSSEYQINIFIPNKNKEGKGKEDYEFILEINLVSKRVHLYSKNIALISDGRDILCAVIPKNNDIFDLNNFNLMDIIKGIKDLILNISSISPRIGRFYLGQEYDINLIKNLNNLLYVPCRHIDIVNGAMIEIPSLCCISDEYLFLFEYGKRYYKNIFNDDKKFSLAFFANLKTLISFKKSIIGSIVTFYLKQSNFKQDNDNDNEKHFELKICSDKDNDMHKVMDVLIEKIKNFGLRMNIFRKKQGQLPGTKINKIENIIKRLETKIQNQPNKKILKRLLALYEKAIEYYSAINDNRYLEFKNKIHDLLINEKYSEFIN